MMKMICATMSEESFKRYIEHASYRCYQELLSDSRADETEGWKPLKTQHGVEISRRKEGQKVVVRGQIIVDISATDFQSFATAITTAEQWDKGFVEGQRLHRLEDNLDILRLVFGSSAAPLLRNREFIVYERRETMDDGTLVVAIESLPKEMAAGILPRNRNLIRGILSHSGWVVEQLEQRNTCMVTYVVQMDPCGWFPTCLANFMTIKLVLVIYHLYKFASSALR